MDKQKVKQKPDDSDSSNFKQLLQISNKYNQKIDKDDQKIKLPEPPLPISTSLLQLLSFKKN
ncbi:unnamed protein product [Paramecium pentaurelia]|uniref:Uncharacterized protein n=1 Tax=Paramecium pentaurelia TaxID=43138 RepID=A0A8S1VB06_9CILI|nr:unnamed protein product [Paramecium pentaurelia]